MAVMLMLMLSTQRPILLSPMEVWAAPESVGVTRLHIDSTAFKRSAEPLSSLLRGAPFPGFMVITSGAEHYLNDLQIRGGSASATKVLFGGVELNNPIDASVDLWLIPSFFLHDVTLDLTSRKSFYGAIELNPIKASDVGNGIVAFVFNPFLLQASIGAKYASPGLATALWAEGSKLKELKTRDNNGDVVSYPYQFEHYAGYANLDLGPMTNSILFISARRELISGSQKDRIFIFNTSLKNILTISLMDKTLKYTPRNTIQWGTSDWATSGIRLAVRELNDGPASLKPSFSLTQGYVLNSMEGSTYYVVAPITRFKLNLDNGIRIPITDNLLLAAGVPLGIAIDKGHRKFLQSLPFASLTYFTGTNSSLRLGYSHVWHLPGFYELYSEYINNPNLIPEEGNEIEAGFSYKKENLTAEIAVYHRKMKQLIKWVIIRDSASTRIVPENIGSATFRGFDIYFKDRLNDFLWLQIGASWVEGWDKNGNELPYLANKTSVSFNVPDYHGFYGSVNAELVTSHQYLDIISGTEITVPAYEWVGLKLGYHLMKGIDMGLEIRNLLNQPCEFKPGYPVEPTTASLIFSAPIH